MSGVPKDIHLIRDYEAAAILGMSNRMLHAMIRRGELTAYQIGKHQLCIDKAELTAHIAASKIARNS